jgi:hypothetical protein
MWKVDKPLGPSTGSSKSPGIKGCTRSNPGQGLALQCTEQMLLSGEDTDGKAQALSLGLAAIYALRMSA